MVSKSGISSIILAGALLTGCEFAPEATTVPAKAVTKTGKEVNYNSGPALLQRLETYSMVGQSPELFSYPVKGDGQFMTLSVDSANRTHVLYTDVASGYAFAMDRLKKKGNQWALDVPNIKVVEDQLMTEGPNPNSFAVTLRYGGLGKASPHGNDTQTNIEELAFLDETGSPFTLAAGAYKSGLTKEQIPASVLIVTEQAKMMVPTGAGLRAIILQEKAHQQHVRNIERRTVKDDNTTDPQVYYVTMDATGAKTADLLRQTRANKAEVAAAPAVAAPSTAAAPNKNAPLNTSAFFTKSDTTGPR